MSEDLLTASSHDPRIGSTFQNYRIVRKIGEGGMGAVYEGEHTLIKRKVAIKCLHAQYATNQEMVNRFQREAMATNSIRHANIVEITDMGRFEDGAVFMVLEFLQGKEFSGLMEKEGALPLGRVVHIAMQVCDALTAAHEQSIVHRDLKPDNIFLVPRGDDDPDFVKVLDFGIAKFRESGGTPGMTRTGMTMGTPHYMAPEQAQASKDLDHRADIYSLGVILFHAITGVLPFDDESFPMLMVKLVSHPAPRLSSVSPQVPPELDELIDRMLAKHPAMRPQSCKDVKAALAPFRSVMTRFAAGRAPEQVPMAYPTPGSVPGTGVGLGYGSNPSQAGYASSPSTATAGTALMHGYGSNPQVSGYGAGSAPSMSGVGAPAAQGSGSKLPLVLLGVGGLALVGVLGVGGLFLASQGSEDDEPPRAGASASTVRSGDPAGNGSAPTPTPTPTPPVVPTPPPVVVPPQPVAPVAAAVPSVNVRINTDPAGASLFLDGNPIANPFDADLPQTNVPRRLEARLDGYQTHVQDLALIYPQRVTIRLQRGTGVHDTRSARTGTSASPTAGRTPEVGTPRPLAPSAPPSTPPPAAPPPRGGDGFTQGSGGGRPSGGFVDVDL